MSDDKPKLEIPTDPAELDDFIALMKSVQSRLPFARELWQKLAPNVLGEQLGDVVLMLMIQLNSFANLMPNKDRASLHGMLDVLWNFQQVGEAALEKTN